MAEEKRVLDNLDQVMEEIPGILKNFLDRVSVSDYEGAKESLELIALKIGEVSPELAKVLSALIDKYGAAFKPITDLVVDKCLASEARMYVKNLDALIAAGFTRKEAMSIIVAKTSKPGNSLQDLAAAIKETAKTMKSQGQSSGSEKLATAINNLARQLSPEGSADRGFENMMRRFEGR